MPSVNYTKLRQQMVEQNKRRKAVGPAALPADTTDYTALQKRLREGHPMEYKQVRGFWIPAVEKHFVQFLRDGPLVHGGPTYQYHKLEAAMKFVAPDRRRQAVDVGAHCGMWSRVMAYDFAEIHAFEPLDFHRECFHRNVTAEHVHMYPYALGHETRAIRIHTHDPGLCTGNSYPKEDGQYPAEMRRLDEFADKLTQVDFLKVDCEGWEYFILQGAEQIVREHKPVIVVEQKPNKGSQFGLSDTAACDLLKGWGAQERQVLSGDYIFTW